MRRARAYAIGGLGALLLSACQTAPPAALEPPSQPPLSLPRDAQAQPVLQLSGRISLSTTPLPGQAAQFFISAFRLSGQIKQGELALQSPTGSLLAVLHWQPGSARIEQAGKADLHYTNLQAMLQAVLGENSPAPELLFTWLQGQNGQHPEWRVDNSQFASKGLITAERSHPLPRTQVRIKLDR